MEEASGRHWALLRVRAVGREVKQGMLLVLTQGRGEKQRRRFLQAVSKLILEVVRQSFRSK